MDKQLIIRLRYRLRHSLLFFILFVAGNLVIAQEMKPSLKREFRAAWIVTVYNIDWPSSPHISPDLQKSELITYLDLLKKLNFNALFLQIRPSSDTFYLSDKEPWSKYLTSSCGKAPYPFYDPLEFAVNEAHKRGIELHAWINPFRVLTSTKQANQLSDKHPYKKLRKYCVIYKSQVFLDPGYKESRDYLTEIVGDIVRRYDIDGIHLDDYFYPDKSFNDAASFSLSKRSSSDKAAWRRDNVDQVIIALREEIRKIKPFVKFGISPAARHTYNYNNLSADLALWMKNGWIDYAIPQLYFYIGQRNADFKELSHWWNDNSYGVLQFAGLASYKSDPLSRDKSWRTPDELKHQIEFIRELPSFMGFCFYNATSLKKTAVQQTIARLFPHPALLPYINGMPAERPDMPYNPGYEAADNGWCHLYWSGNTPYYLLYRCQKGEKPNFEDPASIVALISDAKKYRVSDRDLQLFDYYITALDRLHNESMPLRIGNN